MSDYRAHRLRDPDSTKWWVIPRNGIWPKKHSAKRRKLDVDYIEEPGEAAFYGLRSTL